MNKTKLKSVGIRFEEKIYEEIKSLAKANSRSMTQHIYHCVLNDNELQKRLQSS